MMTKDRHSNDTEVMDHLTWISTIQWRKLEVQVQDIQQQDEYESDSDTERDDEVEFEVVSKTCMTRSGRAVRAFLRLDL